MLCSNVSLSPQHNTHTHTHTHTRINIHAHTLASPPRPSVNIVSSDITARSVTIRLSGCTSPVDDSRYGRVKYVVRYSSSGQELMAEANATTFTTTLGIKGLSAETLYTFTVTCTNVASQNGPSDSTNATTKAEGLSN